MAETTERMTNYERFRAVLLHAERTSGDFLSDRLDSRLNHLLDDTDYPGSKAKQDARVYSFARLMPRVRQELAEIFVDELCEYIDFGGGDPPEEFIDFDRSLYSALDACIKGGPQGAFDWHVVDDEYVGLDTNLDLGEVIIEGGGSDLLLQWMSDNLAGAAASPIQLSDAEKALRPSGASIEGRIQEILAKQPPTDNMPGRFEMALAKAMVEADVDPAYIYAFQATELFVTQENSYMLDAATLRRWDNAVLEYRSKAGKRLI